LYIPDSLSCQQSELNCRELSIPVQLVPLKGFHPVKGDFFGRFQQSFSLLISGNQIRILSRKIILERQNPVGSAKAEPAGFA